MSHELDFSKGKPAFFSLREKPWHGLGTVVSEEVTTIDEILKLSGLDFEVEKLPNVHRIGDLDIVSENSFFTYRKDTNSVLGDKVGSQYTVVQNNEALNVIEDLIATKEVVVHTAGALFGGNRVFITMKSKNPVIGGDGQPIDMYFAVFNSHDGTLSMMTYFTPIRIVCNNTLKLSFGGAKEKVSIRHTASAQTRIKSAMDILKANQKNAEVLTSASQQMVKTKFTQSRFFDYIASVFCTNDEIRDMSSGKHPLEALSTRKQNIIKDVLEFAEVGVGQKEAVAGTAWWALNAVTGYYSNKEGDAEKKVNSLLFGGAEKTIAKATSLALHPERIQGVMNLN